MQAENETDKRQEQEGKREKRVTVCSEGNVVIDYFVAGLRQPAENHNAAQTSELDHKSSTK